MLTVAVFYLSIIYPRHFGICKMYPDKGSSITRPNFSPFILKTDCQALGGAKMTSDLLECAYGSQGSNL